MALLIQLPNNASTSKYPKTFPQPLNLLAIATQNCELIDVALECYKKKKEDVFKILDHWAEYANTWYDDDIYINAGDFPPDAAYSVYYDYFFDKMTVEYTAIGTYPKLYRCKLERRYSKGHFSPLISYIINTDYNLLDFEKYPKVGNKLRASMRVSTGCPRTCKMCPVPDYFEGTHAFFDINYSIDIIQKLYDRGARYITFIDDNLSISPKFVKLLIAIKRLKLKDLVLHGQEGFDIQSITPKLCRLLKKLNFDDIKIAFETIVPRTTKLIGKESVNPSSIQNAIDLIKEFKLDVKTFFLLGLDETEHEIITNLKFFAKNKLTIRANIVRDYGTGFVKEIDRKLTDKQLKHYKALAYASSFFTERFKFNIFEDDGVKLESLGFYYDGKDTLTGKTKYGFQTSRFEKGIKYFFNREIKENTGDSIVFVSEDTERRTADTGTDDEPTGFSAEALKKSRTIRKEFLDRHGIDGKVPTSILLHDRKESRWATIDLSVDARGGNYVHHYRKNKQKISKQDNYTPGLEDSGLHTQGRTDYLSAFPQNVGRIITDLYCPDNGVVYDPFAGHNSRMQMCFRLNRDYIGVDVCHEFMVDNHKIRSILYERRDRSLNIKEARSWIKLIEGSSADVDLPDELADFTITSPPYWNLEYYGDEPEQLGNAKTYEKFLYLLANHVRENYRILKEGAFCAWFINDFRKNKKFYPYHIDIYRLLEAVGFEPFNVYILDLGATVGHMFVQDVINHKLLPKAHEYCILVRKPGPDWWKND